MGVSLDVEELVERVPTPSGVALEVLRVVEDQRADMEELTAVLERDPALAGRVLFLANSAFYSRGKHVTTIGRAALVLGFRTLKVAALGFAIADGLPKDGTKGGLSLQLYWTRSVAQALSSRGFACAAGSPYREEAYLCGLLGEIGRIGFALAVPDDYRALTDEVGPWPTQVEEQHALGMASSDFGSLLLGTWGLPSSYLWAPLLLQGHDVPDTESTEVRAVAPAVTLAGAVVETLFSDRPHELGPVQDLAARRLGLGPEVVEDQLAGLPVDLMAAFGQFGFPQTTGAEAAGLVLRAREAAFLLAAGGDVSP